MAADAEVINGETEVVEMDATSAIKPSSPKKAETIDTTFDCIEHTDDDNNVNSNSNVVISSDVVSDDGVKDSSEEYQKMKNDIVTDMLKKLKLNPMAKEFFPSSYNRDHMVIINNIIVPSDKIAGNDGVPTNALAGGRYRGGGRRRTGK